MSQILGSTLYRSPADAVAAPRSGWRFGWNACSSALCHQGHGTHDSAPERRSLIVPGIRSSRIYVLDTAPDPRNPRVVREIPAEELARKAGYSRPHTVHCAPGGIFLSALGGADGNDGPGGIACSTMTPSMW